MGLGAGRAGSSRPAARAAAAAPAGCSPRAALWWAFVPASTRASTTILSAERYGAYNFITTLRVNPRVQNIRGARPWLQLGRPQCQDFFWQWHSERGIVAQILPRYGRPPLRVFFDSGSPCTSRRGGLTRRGTHKFFLSQHQGCTCARASLMFDMRSAAFHPRIQLSQIVYWPCKWTVFGWAGGHAP